VLTVECSIADVDERDMVISGECLPQLLADDPSHPLCRSWGLVSRNLGSILDVGASLG